MDPTNTHDPAAVATALHQPALPTSALQPYASSLRLPFSPVLLQPYAVILVASAHLPNLFALRPEPVGVAKLLAGQT